MAKLIELLISPPILSLPDWDEPFRLHTDASEIGAGAILTEFNGNIEKVFAYASNRWSVSEETMSATDRECLAILWVLDQFASYVRAKPFTVITDCAVLIWLLESQVLSAKYHRWALRLMEHGMVLEWRPGTRHQLTDAL